MDEHPRRLRPPRRSRFPACYRHRGIDGTHAILHACTIGDDLLVGIGATVMNGARVGASTLIAGIPGKVRRSLTT